jgi:hypothetical protein
MAKADTLSAKHETPQGVFCWVEVSPSFIDGLLGALLPVTARKYLGFN